MPTRYFLRDTPLGGTERAMQIPAGFRPRGGGVRVFRYSAEDCDCRYCLHMAEKEKRCRAASCVCFPERLGAGCVPYSELVSLMAAEISVVAFTMRIQNLLQEKEVMELLFRNARHKNRWNSIVKKGMLNRAAPAFAAALFLLTADEFLWNKSRYHVDNGKISFAEIDIRGVDPDGYAIFKTAKELYGGEYVDMHEYVDIPSSEAVNYKDEILAAIERENLPDERDRGLMVYFHGVQAVAQKVYSAHPTVEEYEGELWGVMEVKLRGRLTEAETKILTDYFTGQYSDGWGEGFEQRPVKTPDGDLYISFWDSEGFSIQPESKLKNLPVPVVEQPKEFSVALKAADYNYAPSVGYLDLPATQPEILDAMDRARVRDGQEYIVEICDVHREYLCPLLPENPSLYELNYLAERLSELNDFEAVCFEGVVQMEKEPPDPARLINFTYNLDSCQIAEARNDAELGRFYAENDFVTELEGVSDKVFALLDFEKLGRSMREAENGVFLKSCYVVQPVAEQNLVFPYDGNPPKPEAEPAYIFRLYAIDPNGAAASGMWLELPADEHTLAQLERQLGVSSMDSDCVFTQCVSEIPQLNAAFSGYEDIGELNDFAHKLSEIKANGELPKYKAALELTMCEDLSDCVRLADNLNAYDYYPNAVTAADCGEQEFFAIHGLHHDDEGMEYFDFAAFGKKYMEANGVVSTPYGMIRGNGLEQTLAYEPEQGNSGPQMGI